MAPLFLRADVFNRVILVVSSLAILIAFLYGVYTPSFGNDTWRDAKWALQIIFSGGFKNIGVAESPYPFPLVPLLYSAQSIITGLDPLWSSSIIGLIYLLILSISSYALARLVLRDHNSYLIEDSFLWSQTLLLSTSIIVLWSVWFIPQAYSLSLFLLLLCILFRKSDYRYVDIAAAFLLLVPLVVGHGGVATFSLGLLLLFYIIQKLATFTRSDIKMLEEKKLVPIILLFTIVYGAYLIYTAVFNYIRGAGLSIIEAIKLFLIGVRVSKSATRYVVPLIPILHLIPVSIIISLSTLAFFKKDTKIYVKFLILALLGTLAVTFIGTNSFPDLDLTRYFGYPSLVLLAILTPIGFTDLSRRGRLGIIYSYILLVVAIASFTFSGALMPENTYTASPHTFGVYGLITYSEATQLSFIGGKLYGSNILTDWRSGGYLLYIHTLKSYEVKALYRGYYVPSLDINVTFAGSYGYIVSNAELAKVLQNYKTMFIARLRGLTMPEAFISNITQQIKILRQNLDVLYSSENIIIIGD